MSFLFTFTLKLRCSVDFFCLLSFISAAGGLYALRFRAKFFASGFRQKLKTNFKKFEENSREIIVGK